MGFSEQDEPFEAIHNQIYQYVKHPVPDLPFLSPFKMAQKDII